MPRFPTTICDRNLDLASEYLASLKYAGPVGMSCDDTKLHLALRTYWDPAKECHFLVGVIGEHITVKDETTVRELMDTHKQNAATKVFVTYIFSSNPSDFVADPCLDLANSPAQSIPSGISCEGYFKQYDGTTAPATLL
jgi:hypothetical protein